MILETIGEINGASGHRSTVHWDEERQSCKVEMRKIEEAAAYLADQFATAFPTPQLAVICGSGLHGIYQTMDEGCLTIPYDSIPHFEISSVPGHQSKMVVGKLNGVCTICLLGRFHFYEGYPMSAVAFPVRVLAQLGIRNIIITNSAGGLNEEYLVGDVMVIEDHISFTNLSGLSPLRGENNSKFGPRFPPLTVIYHPLSFQMVKEAASSADVSLTAIRKGVYVGVGGPAYETPAEVRFLRMIGGDAVGMSTVPEVITAAHCGMKIVALSLITNQATGKGLIFQEPSHAGVLEASSAHGGAFQNLVCHLCPKVSTLFE